MFPGIYGWRMAAGGVLWLGAALLILAWGLIVINGTELNTALAFAGVIVGWVAIAAGFWRGNRAARWLAFLPALAIFLGALIFWGLSSICTSSLPLAFSCPPGPLPPVSIGAWLIRVALLGAGGLVVAGIFLPGRVTQQPSDGSA